MRGTNSASVFVYMYVCTHSRHHRKVSVLFAFHLHSVWRAICEEFMLH